MVDSQFYDQNTLHLVYSILYKQDVAQSVDNFCKKVKKSWYFYRLKTMVIFSHSQNTT